LADEEQARFWLERLGKEEFQATINGVSLVERHNVGRCSECGRKYGKEIGVQYSITRPDDFRKVFFHIENIPANGKIKGGERVTVFSDEIRLVLMAHRSQPAARITVSKTGKQKYNPFQGAKK
jgi:hypothetical protein